MKQYWEIEDGCLVLNVLSGSEGGSYVKTDPDNKEYPWMVYEWTDGCPPRHVDSFSDLREALELAASFT